MIVERITAQAQAKIPDAVLEALGLAPGDAIAFDIVDGRVSLHRGAMRSTAATSNSLPG